MRHLKQRHDSSRHEISSSHHAKGLHETAAGFFYIPVSLLARAGQGCIERINVNAPRNVSEDLEPFPPASDYATLTM
jgi:hypothetical protein